MNNDRSTKIEYLLYFLTDTFVALFSWIGATVIRFEILNDLNYRAHLTDLIISGLIMVFILIYTFHANGLYKQDNRYTSWTKEMQTIFKSATQTFVAGVIVIYFVRYSLFSRLTLFLFYFILLIFLIIARVLLHNREISRRKKGLSLKKIVFVGSGTEMLSYISYIERNPMLGIKAIGWYDPPGDLYGLDIPIIKTSLKEFVEMNEVDSLIVEAGHDNQDKLRVYQKEIYDILVSIVLLSDTKYNFLNSSVDNLDGLTLLHQNSSKMDLTERAVKRCVDILGALIAIIIFTPFFILIPIVIKISSPGSIFYGQIRMTRSGRNFKMWKFRSMRSDAESNTGAVWAKKGDPRTTKFGSFLRKTSLDEIPQFFNVLLGNMSLVGPRPERPELVEKFREDIPGYMIRHTVKAGITGWAQVNGWRGNTCLYKRIEYDIRYINDWSVWFDFKILLLTLFNGFVNKNAY